MKVYRMTFADPEQGFIVQWRRNQKQCNALIAEWHKKFPLRNYITQSYVDVPTDKTEFVDWLNKHATREVT